MNNYLIILLKGFLMGAADIVPGISGGTVAFVTGIYERLVTSISSVDKKFLKLMIKFQIKDAFHHIDGKFISVLLLGIASAIILMSKVIHYALLHIPSYTWSLFLGIIIATIFIMAKDIQGGVKAYLAIGIGIIFGNIIINLAPMQTSHSLLSIYLSALVAICAMLLPGISGAFILLILGKYEFITSILKNPFAGDHWLVILIFCVGALTGLLLFSRLLKYLLKHYKNSVFSFLIGIMMGSLIKIWPWKEVVQTKIIRGKVHTLAEIPYFPKELSMEVVICFSLILLSCILVLLSDYIVAKKKTRGLSSAG